MEFQSIYAQGLTNNSMATLLEICLIIKYLISICELKLINDAQIQPLMHNVGNLCP